MTRIALALSTTLLTLLALTGCSSTPTDDRGRWVGGGEAMTAWAEAHVPSGWHRLDGRVGYEDIIDDFGRDTEKDRTKYTGTYSGVTQEQFAAFGHRTLEVAGPLECEPDGADRSCYLSLYQGQDPLPSEFDLFAVWTLHPDGSTTTDLYLTNDPA